MKIMFKGVEERTGEPFCIIKHGTYPLTKEGLMQALKSGYKDKLGEFPPEFSITRFGTDKRVQGKFYCRINQMSDQRERISKVFGVSIYCTRV